MTQLATHLRGKRILYVDDNHAARSSTVALLKSLGMEVETAEDGDSGLAHFDEDQHDVVITDMSMPGMDGLELAAAIKRRTPAKPVIVLSGWFSVDEDRQPIDLRPDSVLAKPLSCEDLVDNLTALLNLCD